MDSMLLALANLGGVGVLAAALLVLHREAIRAFREELAAERRSAAEQHQRLSDKADVQIRLLQALALRWGMRDPEDPRWKPPVHVRRHDHDANDHHQQ